MADERGLIRGEGYGRERSVLQKIREKELELSVKIDNTWRDADHAVENAKREAAELIQAYKNEGEIAATDQ